MKITPTVGRVVWFYPASNVATSGFTPPPEGHPLAAIIAGVVDAEAGAVHLTVFDGVGVPRSEPYVLLVQEGDTPPAQGRYATWMPYQIGQAKKHADEPKVASAALCAGQIVGGAARDDSYVRFQALDLAIRTPGLIGLEGGHREVLEAARAYQAHIEGAATAAQQQPAPGAAHAGYSTMQPHQQRVVDEKAELDEKRAKLIAFFATPTFAALPADEKDRLEAQEHFMDGYANVLADRIAHF